MPAAAVQDLMEWGPKPTPEAEFAAVLGGELSLDTVIAAAPYAAALQDDRPANEYYFLRRTWGPNHCVILCTWMALWGSARRPELAVSRPGAVPNSAPRAEGPRARSEWSVPAGKDCASA